MMPQPHCKVLDDAATPLQSRKAAAVQSQCSDKAPADADPLMRPPCGFSDASRPQQNCKEIAAVDQAHQYLLKIQLFKGGICTYDYTYFLFMASVRLCMS